MSEETNESDAEVTKKGVFKEKLAPKPKPEPPTISKKDLIEHIDSIIFTLFEDKNIGRGKYDAVRVKLGKLKTLIRRNKIE